MHNTGRMSIDIYLKAKDENRSLPLMRSA